MSHRKSSLFTGRDRGRRSSKIMWITIGIFVFALFVFPYFGSNLRYLISSSLSPLKSVGTLLQNFGLLITVLGIIGMFFSSRRFIKIALIGILMVVIGSFLSNPLNLFSFFTGRSANRGYHFFY